jgi:hypothetical protein
VEGFAFLFPEMPLEGVRTNTTCPPRDLILSGKDFMDEESMMLRKSADLCAGS